MIIQLLCFAGLLITGCSSLTHGRSAKPGEFPYVMRIFIAPSAYDYRGFNDSVDVTGIVAAGILISDTQVLTTCDSVVIFSGYNKVKYAMDRVTIMGGSVEKNGIGGKIFRPVDSHVHPFCSHLLTTTIRLFNYGFYIIPSQKFDNPRLLSPMKFKYDDPQDFTEEIQYMIQNPNDKKRECFAVGWGNPIKKFEGAGESDEFVKYSLHLRVSNMTVTNMVSCMNTACTTYKECLMDVFEYGFMCAKAHLGGPCEDDVGAPLICDGNLYGLHSWTFRCLDIGHDRHFIRIDLALDYIYGFSKAATTFHPNTYNLIVGLLFLIAILQLEKSY